MTQGGPATRPDTLTVTLGDIYVARKALAGLVASTPLIHSTALSELTAADVHLKVETAHVTRAFKIRGATNFLAHLSAEEKARGVVTVSTGNHGRAVALGAQRLGIRAVVFMSELVPHNKREAIARLGAQVQIVGRNQDEAESAANDMARAQGLVPVHPFDDRHVIAGQGTIGIELLESLGKVDTLVCALSGGGLLSGIAVALKSANPATRIVAVSMERGPAMYRSVQAGQPVEVEEEVTLADSLGGGIGLDNRYTFDLVRSLVDEYVLVSEDDIKAGMRHLFYSEGIITEGGGAVSCAALVTGAIGDLRGNVACIVSGGNIDMGKFTAIVAG